MKSVFEKSWFVKYIQIRQPNTNTNINISSRGFSNTNTNTDFAYLNTNTYLTPALLHTAVGIFHNHKGRQGHTETRNTYCNFLVALACNQLRIFHEYKPNSVFKNYFKSPYCNTNMYHRKTKHYVGDWTLRWGHCILCFHLKWWSNLPWHVSLNQQKYFYHLSFWKRTKFLHGKHNLKLLRLRHSKSKCLWYN